MDRTLKPMNLITLIGMAITVSGIFLCLFVLFVPVTFGATLPNAVASGPVDPQVSLRWIQPLLGQAIVEETLMKQQHESKFSEAIKVSDQMTMAVYRLYGGNPRAQASANTAAMKVDHAARVQWVMGRLIVELTRQRVRASMSTADQLADKDTERSLTIAEEAVKKLDDVFRPEWQPRLGRAIVTETLNQARAPKHSPERVGLIF
jgi:hypothetical protein